MFNQSSTIDETVKSMAKNPLGIIALFIVLIGMVGYVILKISATLSYIERLPLIYFLIIFPILVLATFSWLMIKRANNLMEGEKAKNPRHVHPKTMVETEKVKQAKQSSHLTDKNNEQLSKVMWVDEYLEGEKEEERLQEMLGVEGLVISSVKAAVRLLRHNSFVAVIYYKNQMKTSRLEKALFQAVQRQKKPSLFILYPSSGYYTFKESAIQKNSIKSMKAKDTFMDLVVSSLVKRDNQIE